MTPTKRQAEVLAFVRQYIAEHKIAPTYREIAIGVDIKAPTVYYIVIGLAERGLLRVTNRRARGIELIDAPPSLDFLTPELRIEVEKIAEREGVAPHVTVSEIIRSYLGMAS